MLKIKTDVLQRLVAQMSVIKPNRLSEITRYWHIESTPEDGTVFTAYNGGMFLKLYEETKGTIDVIVNAEQFSKIVDRTSSETITLKLTENVLEFKGNGKYKLDIISQDEVYPDFIEALPDELPESFVAPSSMFNDILNVNDSAISKSGADGVLAEFYIDTDKAVTTDSIRVCVNPTIEPISESAVLLSADLMNTIASLNEDELDIYVLDDDKIYIDCEAGEIYASITGDVDEFPDVNSIESIEFSEALELPTQNIKSMLDRLSLFIRMYDNNVIHMHLYKDHLDFITQSGSNESLRYSKKEKVSNESKYSISAIMLKDVLSAINTAVFTLYFGHEDMVKIEADGVNFYIALTEDES